VQIDFFLFLIFRKNNNFTKHSCTFFIYYLYILMPKRKRSQTTKKKETKTRQSKTNETQVSSLDSKKPEANKKSNTKSKNKSKKESVTKESLQKTETNEIILDENTVEIDKNAIENAQNNEFLKKEAEKYKAIDSFHLEEEDSQPMSGEPETEISISSAFNTPSPISTKRRKRIQDDEHAQIKESEGNDEEDLYLPTNMNLLTPSAKKRKEFAKQAIETSVFF